MSKRIKVVILGGSALATPIVFAVMGKSSAGAGYDFVLVGRNTERLGMVQRVSDDIIRSFSELDIKVSTSTDMQKALEGADYIITQVRAGGLEGRAFDETFPRQFGIPGEETVGPGGFSNALRGIPVILDICQTIEKVAPGAVVLNLTNPSSIVQYAVRKFSAVKVIGTCDSPVALTEMVAKMLGVALDDLQFSVGGMHHFGWIAGVEHNGSERIADVLARIDELPKLGTDKEIIQAIGAVPSTYMRYYFHPDRILAATEGRPIRAHQLIKLSDDILNDYRRWKPGETPDMLARRGAAWYEKIVVPTLLALSEKQSTELILSVDNKGAFPWLPDEAIIEACVPIIDGDLQAAKQVDLPQDVKALMAQNCAYEMLAAEAIAEGNREKALRALMSNLLVGNFNQGRGILNVVWPHEEKYHFHITMPEEKKETKEAFKRPVLYYGDDLLENYQPPEDDFAVITMKEPWFDIEQRFKRTPAAVIFVDELDWYRLEAMERALPEVDLIVALGGGTATDAAKYVAWRRHIPVDAFVSITSVDAAVTKSIAARTGGHVTYIGYIVPRDVYIDYPLIKGAPPRLNRSGVGDVLCAHTALWDWKFAHENTGEAYDLAAVQAMKDWLKRVIDDAQDIREVTSKGIQTIMAAFEDVSIICRTFGNSRPQEGSDHVFAYNAEFQTGKSFLHGELVALGTFVMAHFQDNDPDWLVQAYDQMGIHWQPADIGLTRDEFLKTMSTLNWYQKNFGRRYSILSRYKVEEDFIEKMLLWLNF